MLSNPDENEREAPWHEEPTDGLDDVPEDYRAIVNDNDGLVGYVHESQVPLILAAPELEESSGHNPSEEQVFRASMNIVHQLMDVVSRSPWVDEDERMDFADWRSEQNADMYEFVKQCIYGKVLSEPQSREDRLTEFFEDMRESSRTPSITRSIAEAILEKKWDEQGECRSCGWHGSLTTDYFADQIHINRKKQCIELPCAWKEARNHRGVRVYYEDPELASVVDTDPLKVELESGEVVEPEKQVGDGHRKVHAPHGWYGIYCEGFWEPD